MIPALIAVLVVVWAVTVAAFMIWPYWPDSIHWPSFRRDRTPCDGVEWERTGRGGPGLAHLCNRQVPTRKVHRVADVEDAEHGGATAMVADYCPKHCPGGCSRGCPDWAFVP